MGYRIMYPSVRKPHRFRQNRSRRAAFTGCFLLLFFVSVAYFWPEGWEAVRKLLLPKSIGVMTDMLEGLSQYLSDGVPVREAFTSLGQDILTGKGNHVY